MWYVTLLLKHFCTLSSSCNAYQACIDNLPSCQGPLSVDVSWWQAVWLLLLGEREMTWGRYRLPGLSGQPQVRRRLQSIFSMEGRWTARTHFQVKVCTGCWMSTLLYLKVNFCTGRFKDVKMEINITDHLKVISNLSYSIKHHILRMLSNARCVSVCMFLNIFISVYLIQTSDILCLRLVILDYTLLYIDIVHC